MKIQINDR